MRQFFESLAFVLISDYVEDEPTNIPFLGEIKIVKSGDTMVEGGRRVELTLEFDPDESLQKNLGQLEDGEKLDIERVFTTRLRNALSEYSD